MSKCKGMACKLCGDVSSMLKFISFVPFAANLCLRRCPKPEQSPLCLYDWELCSIHVPQRDLADFLIYALAKPPGVATAARPPAVATSAKPPNVAAAEPSVVSTSAKLPRVGTSAKSPNVAASTKPPNVPTSAKLPVVATSAKPPNVATSAKPPVVGTSGKSPCVTTSLTELPHTTSSFVESNWKAHSGCLEKDDDLASKLSVPGGHIETIDGATTNTITPDSAYYYEITRQIEKHLRYYHKELLSCLNLETPRTEEITPIRGEMKKTDDSKETTTYELGPLTKKNICTRNRHVLSKVPDFDLFQKIFDYMVIEAFLDRQLHTAMLSEEYRTEVCKRELDIVLFYIESRISFHTFL